MVHRAFGFRFVMFVNDHSPPHLHVVGHGGEAKILLQAQEGLAVDGVSIAWSVGSALATFGSCFTRRNASA